MKIKVLKPVASESWKLRKGEVREVAPTWGPGRVAESVAREAIRCGWAVVLPPEVEAAAVEPAAERAVLPAPKKKGGR